MERRSPESVWLYGQPSPGIVEDWRLRNRFNGRFVYTRVIDSAALLFSPFREWDGSSDIKFSPDQIITIKDGPAVPRRETKLWQIKQAYTESAEGKEDFNGPKGHLHSYTLTPDGKLILRMSDYDWHGMKALGLALRDGKLPERYRDFLLPTKKGDTYTFGSAHPNNTNSHCVVITEDNQLILATRGQAVEYYKGHTAASVEQQTNPQKEHNPFDTYKAAISKLSGQAELNLTVRDETLRLGAIFLEPDVNCAAFLVVGKVKEDSSQISQDIIGKERSAEFSPASNSVWTLPLDKPDELIRQFYHPRGFLWHGTARLRIVAALSYALGHEEAMDRLYKASQAA